jgi:23S rRNA (pseudouridine1915-N3)-methyltransferase
MRKIRLIAVGRLRAPHWQQAAAAYARKLRHAVSLEETIIKDGDASLAPAERAAAEGKKILAAMQPGEYVVCLDERGETCTSRAFADFLRKCFENARPVCCIVGGAYGLAEEVRQRADMLLSFGPMTFPHELARVLLLEQVYRADSMWRNTPYHHE